MADYDNNNRGALFINDRKQTDKHPDYKGTLNVGGTEYWISGWTKNTAKGQIISVQVEPKEAQASAPKPAAKPASAPVPKSKQAPNFSDMNDDIPFSNPYRGKYAFSV